MTNVSDRRLIHVHLLLALAIALAMLLSVLAVQPAAALVTFDVNSTVDASDAVPGNGVCETATAGECTLRAAIEEANALSDGTEVFFITVYNPGTYVLNDQLVVTGQNISIFGTGNEHEVIIDGNNATRVFDIGAASISIFWVTIQGGKNVNSVVVGGHWHGGAIHNHGTLTMSNVIVQDSVIASDTPGAATCTTHCGGAIYNAATASLDNVAFVNNRNEFVDAEAHGGAVANAGTMTVTNATFSGNSTAGGQGSAIYNIGTSTLSYVTVADNGAGPAIAHAGGTLDITASIAANNTGDNCLGSLTSGGYNLSDDGTCTASFTGTGDLDNNPNANLGPLADNGGNTWTHALLTGSVAINHIPPGAVECGTTVTTDQRGESRPQGAGCDIGAFEVIFTQTYFQACLYAGSLSKVSFISDSTATTVNCGRGTAVVLLAGGDVGVDVYHACLYAGSLSKVGETAPTSCGRGEAISLVKGIDLQGCLYAGSLSRLSASPPSDCGRGVVAGLETEP
ncbi:MAG TPA: choice-of-anchor Q domain-containing protein [Thermomicrobiales bacterium]|nr:choice-of-anchor Q domain-containing protein [Thermomicrobiales bacterium]